MNKTFLKMLTGFSSLAGLVLLLLVTFNVTQNTQPFTSQADVKIQTAFLTNRDSFGESNTVLIDFSKINCCNSLSHEYMEEGVIFDNEESLGWNTYQANGFVNHKFVTETESDLPTGITGTRIIFTEPVNKTGFMVQSGSPFNLQTTRPATSLTLKVYDENNDLIFYQVTDTCLSEMSSCRPSFIGVEANTNTIKYLEANVNDISNWSIDDLVYEI